MQRIDVMNGFNAFDRFVLQYETVVCRCALQQLATGTNHINMAEIIRVMRVTPTGELYGFIREYLTDLGLGDFLTPFRSKPRRAKTVAPLTVAPLAISVSYEPALV